MQGSKGLLVHPPGCGSKIGTPNGTLVSRNMDQNLCFFLGGLILTHAHPMSLQNGSFLLMRWKRTARSRQIVSLEVTKAREPE